MVSDETSLLNAVTKLQPDLVIVDLSFPVFGGNNAWWRDYNEHRPHSSLGDETPYRFAANCEISRTAETAGILTERVSNVGGKRNIPGRFTTRTAKPRM